MKIFTNKYKHRILVKIAELEKEKASIRFDRLEPALQVKDTRKYCQLLLEEDKIKLQIKLLKSLL